MIVEARNDALLLTIINFSCDMSAETASMSEDLIIDNNMK